MTLSGPVAENLISPNVPSLVLLKVRSDIPLSNANATNEVHSEFGKVVIATRLRRAQDSALSLPNCEVLSIHRYLEILYETVMESFTNLISGMPSALVKADSATSFVIVVVVDRSMRKSL